MNCVRDACAAQEPKGRPPLKGCRRTLEAYLGPLTTVLMDSRVRGPEYGGASRRMSLMDSGALKAGTLGSSRF